MYRTEFWTLWEKVRVGCFKRTALKHVCYLGWNGSPAQVGCMRQVLRPGAMGKPRGSGWRGRWEEGSGWGTHVNPWLFHFKVWQNPLQIKKKKRKKNKHPSWQVHTVTFKMDKYPGPTVWHRGLCSVSYGSLDGRGVWGRVDTCVCVTVSLLCTWNYHNAVNWLYSSIKQKVEKKQPWIHNDVKTWLIYGERETNPPRRNIPKNSTDILLSYAPRPDIWVVHKIVWKAGRPTLR